MSLKAKITSKLKAYAKEKGFNLSNVRINTLSDRLDAKVDKEDDIDAAIENMDSLVDFKELAALDDAKRNADKKAAEEADNNDPATPPTNDPAPAKAADEDKSKGKDEMPAWFKAHTESQNKVIESLTNKIVSLEQGNTAKSRREQLEAKLKGAPEKFKARTLRDFDRLRIDSDEDFTEYLADIEQDVADEIQLGAEEGAIGPRAGGVGGGKIGEKEVSPLMKTYLSNQAKAKEAEAK